MQKPLILTIITINYNNVLGLQKTIESVVNQTNKNFEYIIIDGGSTDKSVDVINQYLHKVNYWVSEPDKGIYNAMNKGILKANGEYLLFLNSGDVLFDNHIIEHIVPLLTIEDIIFGNGMIDGVKNAYIIPAKLTKRYLCRMSLFHPSTFIKKELFIKNGLYDDNLKIVADWEFFLKNIITKKCSVKKINLCIAKMEDGGISRNENHKHLLKHEVQQTLDKYFPNRIKNIFIEFILEKWTFFLYLFFNK